MSLCMAFLLFDVRRDRSRLNGRVRISIFCVGFCALDGAFLSSLSNVPTEGVLWCGAVSL